MGCASSRKDEPIIDEQPIIEDELKQQAEEQIHEFNAQMQIEVDQEEYVNNNEQLQMVNAVPELFRKHTPKGISLSEISVTESVNKIATDDLENECRNSLGQTREAFLKLNSQLNSMLPYESDPE